MLFTSVYLVASLVKMFGRAAFLFLICLLSLQFLLLPSRQIANSLMKSSSDTSSIVELCELEKECDELPFWDSAIFLSHEFWLLSEVSLDRTNCDSFAANICPVCSWTSRGPPTVETI